MAWRIGINGLTAGARWTLKQTEAAEGRGRWVEGYRSPDGTEHSTRHAFDYGTNYSNEPNNKPWGNQVARFLINNRWRLGVQGIIWDASQIGYGDWSRWIPQWWKPPANWQGDGYHQRHLHVFIRKGFRPPAREMQEAHDLSLEIDDDTDDEDADILHPCGVGGSSSEDVVEEAPELTLDERNVSALATGPALYGVDVSNYQGQMDWQRVKKEGFYYGIVKANEGWYLKDARYDRNMHELKRVGLVPGAYHFLTRNRLNSQLNNFKRSLNDHGGPQGKIVVVDVEDPHWKPHYGPGWPRWNEIQTFIKNMADYLKGQELWLYSAHWFWNDYLGNPNIGSLVNNYNVKVWLSRYVTGTGAAWTLYQKVPNQWWSGNNPPMFGGRRVPAMLQFTDRASVAGKQMDANVFRGTRAELVQLTTP